MHNASGLNGAVSIGIAIVVAIVEMGISNLARRLLADTLVRWHIVQLRPERLAAMVTSPV